MNEHFYAMKHIESIIALIRYTKEVSEEELSNSESESKGRRAYLHGVVDGIDKCLATIRQYHYLERLKKEYADLRESTQ